LQTDNVISSYEFREAFIKRVADRNDSERLVSSLYHFIVPALSALAESRNNQESVANDRATICWQAKETVEMLTGALPVTKENPRALWAHQRNPTVFQNDLVGSINRYELENAAANYLTRNWHVGYLDWCILDALVFMEYHAFILKLNFSIWYAKFAVALWALIAGALLWWLGFANAWVLGLGAVGLIVFRFVPGQFVLFQNRDILMAMQRAYDELNGRILSPRRILEKLQMAETYGVVWPTAVWPVLDAVIARNAVWKIW
jgi:hypothetical protein